MKIAFVVHDYRRMEGHSRYVVELATRFARDHEVHVFANRIDVEDNSNIHFHSIPAIRSGALPSIISFLVQATLHVRGRFDIIHNQGLCGVRGNVFTAHICNRAWHEASREAAGRLSLREWVSGNTLSALEYFFYRTAAKSQVIAVSRRVCEDIRRLYRARAPISVIHHGVDLINFVPAHQNPIRELVRAELDLSEQETAYIFVGDLRKGARQSIEALARLASGKLLLISRSADAPYRALSARLGVEKRVLFLGTRTQVERYYAAADVFLLPTHYDSFAMVVTEAMASALPVIVSREAGASELIHHGENGLLLDNFRDTAELSQKMRLVSEDRMLAKRLGSAARRTAESHSWDRVAAETLTVYERLVASKVGAECKEEVSAI
jgi:UDP-glucose:(heptosyl)LPS alpha-1,3-glucosyltransferase